MAQEVGLNLNRCKFEQLRCVVCSGYLSCAPLRLLPDGTTICGRCSPPNSEVLAYRDLALEALLSNAVFPCKFQLHGCSVCSLFNETAVHEIGCVYQPFSCATSPYTGCLWKGPMSQAAPHFAKSHQDFVREDASVDLQVNQNKEGVLLVVKDGGSFMVKYSYDSSTSNLEYYIKYIMLNVEEQSCKVQLTNASDSDYTIQLKGGMCVAYNTDLHDRKNSEIVQTKHLLPILNNPENITVTFHASLPDRPTFGCNQLQNVSPVQNFVCKWRGCNNIMKGGDAMLPHQAECRHRVYRCLFAACEVTSNRTSMYVHMSQKHLCKIFSEKFKFSVQFTNTRPLQNRYGFTILNNEMVLAKYKVQATGDSLNTLVLNTFCVNPSQYLAVVHFEHDHCKRQSRKFSFRKEVEIRSSDLPGCFRKGDVLVATLILNSV